jgi:hypothetical protein
MNRLKKKTLSCLTICPGCGLLLSGEDKMDKQYQASASCRQLSHELSAYTLSLRDEYFIHQLVVDAYAAQHAGEQVKPLSTAFALIGLYLAFEHGRTGKEVQNTHMLLARKSKVWPRFTPPKEKATLTVRDVVQSPDEQKNEMIKKWARSVWDMWGREHEAVAQLVQKVLRVEQVPSC